MEKRERRKGNKKMSRYIKILSITSIIIVMLIGGNYYFTKNQTVSVLADTALRLTTSNNEVMVNRPFIVTVSDTGATPATVKNEDKENQDSGSTEEIELKATEPIKEISKTIIYLPLGMEFDESGTSQLNDGKKIAVVTYDSASRNLEIDWIAGEQQELQISLISKNSDNYDITAKKSVNNQVNESDVLSIHAVGMEELASSSDELTPATASARSIESALETFALEVGTAVVTNAAELSAAITDLSTTQIYFGNDINLNQSIKIPNGKPYLRISGKNPSTGEIHTLTESNGTIGGTDNIYVSNNNSDPKDYGLEDMKIIGRNYYGPLNVQDNTKEVSLSYTNIDYQGPQITHNVNGITKYLGETSIYIARVQSTSAANQEVAEARNVIMDGNITINHTSNSDSMFWLGLSGGSENSFTVKENSNIMIDSKGNGMFYRDGTNPITMDIEQNATVKITTNNGLFRNNPGKYLHVGENANVEFEKTGGDQPVLRLTEDLNVAKGARLVMKATGGSGNFARFERAYSGTNLNFDDPLSVLLYNKTAQQMFAWQGTGNSSGKMHINSPIVNYWRVAGTGDRDDLPLFSWSMPDRSNVLTDVTTNGSNSTVINATNAGITATDFNMGTAKVISLGTVDVALDPITDAQTNVTGTATKNSKVYIDYTEVGVKKTLTGYAGTDGTYSIPIPDGFIKPYTSVTATANLDFKTKVSAPVIVEDVTPPEGTAVIQVLEQGGVFPSDSTKFVKDIQDKSDGTTGAGVTVTAGSISQPDMNQFGPVLPMYEVILTDKAGNKTTLNIPIFIKDADTAVSNTTALKAKNITFKLPQYPQTEAELKAFIQKESAIQVWELETGNEVTDLSSLTIDTSKMKQEVGVYPVMVTFGNVQKEIQVEVTPGTGTVVFHYQDEEGNKLAEDKTIVDDIGKSYTEKPIDLNGYLYLRTQGNATGVIEDQTQEVLFIYQQNRFKLTQTVTKLDGSSAEKVALTEAIKVNTVLDSQLTSVTPTVFYKDLTITVPIEDTLTDVGTFSLKREDGTSVGQITYDAPTKSVKATISEADQIPWNENITMSYQATVKEDAPLATIITTVGEASGNYTNDWIANPVKSNTTKTEIVDGKLTFVSAPKDLDFGENLKIPAVNKKYPLQSLTGSLTVQDTRSIKGSWTLSAKMDQVLTSTSNKTLPTAVQYTNNGQKSILGTSSIMIYQQTNADSKPISITDNWLPNGDGLALDIKPETTYPESYKGSIEWTLQDTP
ncbi:MucBP domain-containing protein [Carnobacterium divergens]|uniref:WxL domain-containing protein n=1 Tax=Carnobacterium divergens TaxID=2748 RepID=A0A7Z8D0K4_CARDV|nr:MucBP domain-containing protein [Carnobacterium divergens]TFI72744.1 hypothetical protein CKN58_07115 [Carnobacterium divergens]TFI77183.1 hypothetical protein CKN85_07155 [Carnobacterium divergens]TFI83484.1 hypothetical protein CKN56_07195 [Carnobacterium divergens]TFI95589.1 hypothetical protein CKN64_07135 [Carnobacterium divergens]TFJ11949.1 hypothetical protein CKN60_07200 [Carnobacterium divergens]